MTGPTASDPISTSAERCCSSRPTSSRRHSSVSSATRPARPASGAPASSEKLPSRNSSSGSAIRARLLRVVFEQRLVGRELHLGADAPELLVLAPGGADEVAHVDAAGVLGGEEGGVDDD